MFKNKPVATKHPPWNKGKLTGRIRDLALFNLAIDSKHRGCNLAALRVDDVTPHGHALDRATVKQKKTNRSVKFEITDHTRAAIDDCLQVNSRKYGDYLFSGRGNPSCHLSNTQYARLVGHWVALASLDLLQFGTHSLRRKKATLIYRKTVNLRAVQLLLGHTKIESTVRYLSVEIDDTLAIAEQFEV